MKTSFSTGLVLFVCLVGFGCGRVPSSDSTINPQSGHLGKPSGSSTEVNFEENLNSKTPIIEGKDVIKLGNTYALFPNTAEPAKLYYLPDVLRFSQDRNIPLFSFTYGAFGGTEKSGIVSAVIQAGVSDGFKKLLDDYLASHADISLIPMTYTNAKISIRYRDDTHSPGALVKEPHLPFSQILGSQGSTSAISIGLTEGGVKFFLSVIDGSVRLDSALIIEACFTASGLGPETMTEEFRDGAKITKRARESITKQLCVPLDDWEAVREHKAELVTAI